MASRWKRVGCVLVLAILVASLASLVGWRLSLQMLSSARQQLSSHREKQWKEAVQAAIDRHFLRCQAKEFADRVRVVSVKREFPPKEAPDLPSETKESLGLERYAALEDASIKASNALVRLFFEIPTILKECSIIVKYRLNSKGTLLDVYTFYCHNLREPSDGIMIDIGTDSKNNVVFLASDGIMVDIGIDSKNNIVFLALKEVGSRVGLSGNATLNMEFTKFENRNGCLVPVNGNSEIMLPKSDTESISIYAASVRFDYSEQQYKKH